MAINALSLPVDIPWKRLCVSEDMIDRKPCDREFPKRWRSSVTVFGYEPPKEYQTYEGMTVSYLKVSCTITGYQADPDEIGLSNRRVDSYWNDPKVIENYKEIVSQYYGCYGAILEVAVTPVEVNENTPIEQYPYIADFEPKKRELYEIVSETGEVLSRTLEDINVRKGTTTTNSTEVADMFLGYGWNLGVEVKGSGGQVGQNASLEKGTRNINQQEYADIRTTDRAREMREVYSHTTQLTQMYHQLIGYHLGTNRAVFAMLPRPHIVQTEETFVNGPRLLEGIQEVFFVVMRPKNFRGFCVEAYLETAHIFKELEYSYETRTEHIGKITGKTELSSDSGTSHTFSSGSLPYDPPDGWEIDVESPDGGYHIEEVEWDNVSRWDVSIDRDHAEFIWEVMGMGHFKLGVPGRELIDIKNGRIEVDVYIDLRSKKPSSTSYLYDNLFLTGRGVCCCHAEESILSDDVLSRIALTIECLLAVCQMPRKASLYRPESYPERSRNDVGMTIREANLMRAEIGEKILRSINDPDRHPRGTTHFSEASFIAKNIVRFLKDDAHPDNQLVSDIHGLDPQLCQKVVEIEPRLRRRDLLEKSLGFLKDHFSLSYEEAISLRRSALGLKGELPPPGDRWVRPNQRKVEKTIPNLVRLPLDKAQKALVAKGFLVGDVEYQDSELPRGTVLSQMPASETTKLSGSEIHLIVASGARVHIPDVVGQPLSQVMLMLKEAGLESEPEIRFIPSEERSRNYVIEVTPAMRTYITPHANVVLQVSSGPSKQH